CPVSASSLSEESSEDELTLLRRLRRLSSESELGGLSLGERRFATPSSVRLSAPNSGPLFRMGGGGGSVVFVPGTVWGGVVKVARCRPSVLVIVAVVWVVPRGGPIAVKTRSYGAVALPEACLEIYFGGVLSVGSHGWRQSVDTKVGRSEVINMPRAIVDDTSRTKSYIPKVSEIPGFSPVINMPQAIIDDTSRTKSYIPKVSEIPSFSPVLAQFYKPIENRCIHEGRVVDQLYYTRVMRPLALKQTRKPRSEHEKPKARHSVSSSSGHHLGSSSHHEEDDEDEGTSQDSTPSPTTYLNSLQPLNYQRYDIPTSSQQDDDLLFERQTDLLNQTQKLHEEVRGGFKSFGKALKDVFSKKKK
ncbi:hypothetical protein Tco_1232575, partial [Tanacetum coccineum]